MNLRELARGQPCMLRTVYCNDNRETTVGCHLRMIGISGAGMKAPDLFIAWGCSACHDVVDGRTKTPYTPEERRLLLLEGMVRTQYELIKRDVLTW